jgi:hypothetical protein
VSVKFHQRTKFLHYPNKINATFAGVIETDPPVDKVSALSEPDVTWVGVIEKDIIIQAVDPNYFNSYTPRSHAEKGRWESSKTTLSYIQVIPTFTL